MSLLYFLNLKPGISQKIYLHFIAMFTYLKKVSCPSFSIFQRRNDINIIIPFLMPIIICASQIMRNIDNISDFHIAFVIIYYKTI